MTPEAKAAWMEEIKKVPSIAIKETLLRIYKKTDAQPPKHFKTFAESSLPKGDRPSA